VWDEPYLETCCRAALHRLHLAGPAGRPGDQMDGPCLRRLAGKGLVTELNGGRFVMSPDGTARHAAEVMKHPGLRKAAP
jgi:hypothetical protein